MDSSGGHPRKTRPLGTGSSWKSLRQSGGKSSQESNGHRSGRACPDACSALWAICLEQDCSSCSWLLQGPGSRPQGRAVHLGTAFQPPALPLRPPRSPGSTWSTQRAPPDASSSDTVLTPALCKGLCPVWRSLGSSHPTAPGLGPRSAMARPPQFPLARCPGCRPPIRYLST